MSYPELSPQEVLAAGPAASGVNDRPWLVRWDRSGDDAVDLVRRLLPPALDFHTSGTTGPSECWRRTREQLWEEAGMLAALLRPHRPEAVLSFAPPRHVYGALATLLVPVRLGLPVWYRPHFFGAMPPPPGGRWAVIAVPWSFSALRRKRPWVDARESLAVLHSTAMLPSAAAGFVQEAGRERVSVTEVFGSTETGGIAWRRWGPDDPRWNLFDDVELDLDPGGSDDPVSPADPVAPADPAGRDVPLTVRSPRLAARPGLAPLDRWQTDDLVQPCGARRFRFSGRRGRLVKINGRRVDLGALERSLRDVVDCADLACVPVADELSGEHLELYVVPPPGGSLDRARVRALVAARDLTAQPRQVHVVDRIDRSGAGLPRRILPTLPADAGAAT
ncbi:long-chain fatty acid--CoA ligase [Streptomyces lasiicapitis]|uniref:Long-chain fatty acid--CoA ligase n=1 Tax=Streptomyces lasiicapitis TaxID=1923961 RepID=A0ABQ2MBZ7_9ACTN|nr:long-chain fatty acid--CoA ligase [Streptomyces lasiicapitis]GGO49558.1 hypothetical protein GCM10012286_47840 [Streptomyces lasiicapitis]